MDFYDEAMGERVPHARRHARKIDPEQAADIERRMAAMRTRYLANQHGCRARKTGSCDHPNHRRDVDYAHEMLDMLGFDHTYPAYTPEENLVWLKWLRQAGPPDDTDLSDVA